MLRLYHVFSNEKLSKNQKMCSMQPNKGGVTMRLSKDEWDMLVRGEKWVLFLESDDFIEWGKQPIVVQDDVFGKVLGEITIENYIELMFKRENVSMISSGYYARDRTDAIREIYIEWCARNGHSVDENEGWFKSVPFSEYMKKIGWGNNYVVFLQEVKEMSED